MAQDSPNPLSSPASAGHPQFSAQLLREFSVSSQPEGCAVDDERQRLFFGIEDEGVRTISANHLDSAPAQIPTDIDGEMLAADVESMDLFFWRERSRLFGCV